MLLSESPLGLSNRVERLGGAGSFRRRLMELGLLPGTCVTVVGRAPLGGPVELLVRGCSLTLGHDEAGAIEVSNAPETRPSAVERVGTASAPSPARPITAGPRGWIRAALRGAHTSS